MTSGFKISDAWCELKKKQIASSLVVHKGFGVELANTRNRVTRNLMSMTMCNRGRHNPC
jgi:hypothetical protein